MKYTCPIFIDARHVRDASVNIYPGGPIFTHIMGYPAANREIAERMALHRTNPAIYRINVKSKVTNVG